MEKWNKKLSEKERWLFMAAARDALWH